METNKHFSIDCGIYPFRIYLFFSEISFVYDIMKEKISEKSLKKLKPLFKDSNHNGRFILLEDNRMIIHLHNIPKSIDDLSILNHEILHATICIHRLVDMNLCHDTEESYTYLMEYLQKQIYINLGLEINYGK